MIPEELLLPRYKVIATWPGMAAEPFYLSQVFTLQPYYGEDKPQFIHTPIKHIPGSYMRQGFFEQFPHLFKELAWWEERKPEEMPEFVKLNPENTIGGNKVFNVVDAHLFDDGVIGLKVDDKDLSKFPYTPSKYYLPATREEYEAYLKSQT